MQTLYPEQLDKALQQQPLPPIVLIFGEEPLLRRDAIETIRQRIKQQYPGEQHERTHWIQDADFDWQQLTDAEQSLSLFSQFKLLELELPDNKPGRTGSDILSAYAKANTAEQLLVVIGDRLKKEQQNSRWFKTLAEQAWLVRTPTPDRARLPKFIHQRASRYQLNLAKDATMQLAQWFEGNLSALDQELQKWALMAPQTALTASDVAAFMQDVSHFDAFSIQDSLLHNDLQQASHRLHRLFQEDVDEHQLLWVFQREVNTLSQVKAAQQQRLAVDSIFRQQMIWSSQQSAYQARAKQLSETALIQAQRLMVKLEHALKLDSGDDPQVLFSHLLALICVGPHQPNITQQLAVMTS